MKLVNTSSGAATSVTSSDQGESAINAPKRVIRKIPVITEPQTEDACQFETTKLLVDAMKSLGINAELITMPWTKLGDEIWFNRDKWDITAWSFGIRPERLDPQEFIFNVFHSSTAKDGYNFEGYINPEYDKVAEEQRKTIDKNKRQALVKKAQEILANDVPILFCNNPMQQFVYNTEVFDSNSVVDMPGLGILNYWTFININPIGNVKDIILNSVEDFKAINPFYLGGIADGWAAELIFDRVMRLGADSLPKPYAAKSVEWTSDTECKIVLRQDMAFTDGVKVTADDVKFSYEVPLLTDKSPAFKPFVSDIDTIQKVDDYTLIIKLKQPSASFETSCLSKMPIAPKHIWEPIVKKLEGKTDTLETITRLDKNLLVGSGPFKFVGWQQNEKVIMEANKNHFEVPKVDKWICIINGNMESTLGMIQSGDINFLSQFMGDGSLLKEKVDAAGNLKMASTTSIGANFFAMNNRRAPFDDVAFRRAIAAVLDRQAIVDIVWKGFAVPNDSIISPNLTFWKNTDLKYPSGGLKEAKKILKDAGYEWDKEGRLLYPKGKIETLKSNY